MGSKGQYEDGEVVWVKLGPCWWPGRVVGNDKLPPDILPSLKKVPIAAVKFFQEDTFEYVRSSNCIEKYNCSRKHDFIKKGLQDLRRGLLHMAKFPADVSTAETLTDGDPDIINQEKFEAEVKSPTANGSPKKSTTKGSRDRPAVSTTRRSNASQGSDYKSEYTARILVQPSPTHRNSCDKLSDTSSIKEEEVPKEVGAEVKPSEPVLPRTPQTPQRGAYTCHSCPFTTARLNIMIMHNKSHSGGLTSYAPSPIRPQPRSRIEPVLSEIAPNKETAAASVETKGRRKRTQEDAPDATPAKRSSKAKETKKPKSEAEIKNSLLADWSEDSNNSMDLLTTLRLTDLRTASPEVEIDEPKVPKKSIPEPEAEKPSDLPKEIENLKEPSSCFDFKEEEEWPEEADIGRKIPRVNLKPDTDTAKKISESRDDEVKTGSDSRDIDLDSEVDNLLNLTAMPELPTIPRTMKHNENFPELKTIKFPDKKEVGPERPPAKTIFKTKSFFRSRHSRSQDAIEKYIADNTNVNAEKSSSYVDRTEDPDLSDADKRADIGTTFDLFESDPAKHVHVPQTAKVTKLTPKIQLKQMKAAAQLKQMSEAVEVDATPSVLVDVETKTVTETKTEEVAINSKSKETVDISSETNIPLAVDATEITESPAELENNSANTKDNTASTKISNDEKVQEDIDNVFDANIVTDLETDKNICKVGEMIRDEWNDDDMKELNNDNVAIKDNSLIESVSSKIAEESPSESDLQIAETLINLPGPMLQCEVEDKNLNAAESLVQMSEALQNNVDVGENNMESTSTADNLTVESQMAVLNDAVREKISPPKVAVDFETSSSKLLQILEEPSPQKMKTSLKVSPQTSPQKCKEKILNFGVNSPKNTSSQPQKIIIRRAGPSPLKTDVFPNNRNLNLQSKRDEIQTYTIKQNSNSDPSTFSLQPKTNKIPMKSQKILLKPHSTMITSTGAIVQSKKSGDESLFDINSMPIVLSDDLVNPENVDRMPVVKSDGAVTALNANPKIKPIVSDLTNQKPALKSELRTNIIIKPVVEKTSSPNILSKSAKGRNIKPMLPIGKTSSEQTVVAKVPGLNEPRQMIIAKQAPNIITQQGPSGKIEKFIILPSSPVISKQQMPNKRQQKIILNPQTGKARMVYGDLVEQPKAKATPRLMEPSGGTVMIITNAQGVQSQLVIAPEQEKLLFPKKSVQSTTITSQTIVTSKGALITPSQTPKGRSSIVTSQSIITSKGQLLTTAPADAIITSRGQLVRSQSFAPRAVSNPIANPIAKRTILTATPGQTILTSKGQLITSQATSSTTTATTTPRMKMVSVSDMRRPMPIAAEAVSSVSAPARPVKEQRMIVLEEQSGGIIRLSPAEFKVLQKTGKIVASKTARRTKTEPAAAPPKPRPVAPIVESAVVSRKSGATAVKRKPQSTGVSSVEADPLPSQSKRQKTTLRPDRGDAPESTPPLVSETLPAAPDADREFANLDDLIPSTTIQVQKAAPRETEAPRARAVEEAVAAPPVVAAPVAASPAAPPLVPIFAPPVAAPDAPQALAGDGQLLAVPGENFGGPPDSFYLCFEENGVLTPVDNQALVLENNQLVPMRAPLVERPTATAAIDPTAAAPADAGQQSVLINAGDQQILLDQQTLMSLLGGDGQQLVTVDGQQLVLQGNVQQILAALAGAEAHVEPARAPAPVPAHPSADGYAFEQPHAANQDILAAALANTDVFRQDSLAPDALDDVVSAGADFNHLNANVSSHSSVSETSSTLNQPIMTPLEVPTKKKSARVGVATNLEESLAEIGVTALSVPASLALPITVTDPHIAPKTTNPLSLPDSVYRPPRPVPTATMRPSATEPSMPSLDDPLDEAPRPPRAFPPMSMPLLTDDDIETEPPPLTPRDEPRPFPKSMPVLTDDEPFERVPSPVPTEPSDLVVADSTADEINDKEGCLGVDCPTGSDATASVSSIERTHVRADFSASISTEFTQEAPDSTEESSDRISAFAKSVESINISRESNEYAADFEPSPEICSSAEETLPRSSDSPEGKSAVRPDSSAEGNEGAVTEENGVSEGREGEADSPTGSILASASPESAPATNDERSQPDADADSQGEFADVDAVPPTPPMPLDAVADNHRLSDSSSDSSAEIPLQPSISVSRRAVGAFARDPSEPPADAVDAVDAVDASAPDRAERDRDDR